MTLKTRASGILLHPTSLPSAHGIGDLGYSAYRFVDYLHQARQRYWQILPLGPTGFGNSPYASISAFAGNPLLIDLVGWDAEIGGKINLEYPHGFDDGSVDFDQVCQWKLPRLRALAAEFLSRAAEKSLLDFRDFCQRNLSWLDDFALFSALKQHFDIQASQEPGTNSSWNVYWDRDIAHREPLAIARWTDRLSKEIAIEKVLQYFFHKQWNALRDYATSRGIEFIGDVPIFVAMDSCDVWASPRSFLLDQELQPTVVAGVPPDYFSETGQLWGNPLYNWDVMQNDQFAWWVGRMKRAFEQVSMVRLDHFRGFESCWSIPATDKNAVRGQWVKSPGDRLLATIRQAIGDASIIAEDLGVITPEVEALRIRYGFPGMRILQFAFDENETRSDYFLPHNYDTDTVAYTGTHDNETVKGWFNNQPQRVRDRVLQYLGGHSDCISWDFIVLAMSSKANTVILPMQDVLGLGNESRFNRPATLGGNWQWRLRPSYPTDSPSERLAKLVQETDRDRMFSIAMQSKPDH